MADQRNGSNKKEAAPIGVGLFLYLSLLLRISQSANDQLFEVSAFTSVQANEVDTAGQRLAQL